MLPRLHFHRILIFLAASWTAQAALVITPRQAARQWSIAEFSIAGAPAAANPFDPDLITLRGTFTAPSGKTTVVEGFWYQNYTTTLNSGNETLTAQGAPEWRMRFTPGEAGAYQLALQAITPAVTNTASLSFNAAVGADTNHFQAVPKISAAKKYFELAGQTLPLNGANVCWPGSRGTFDYLDWFPAMNRNGENYARLWMCPWAFGIEAELGTRTNYNLSHAWQLDQTMRIAATNNIWLLLCLEYHGMYQTVPDQFGGNNGWVSNPYNSANGGPCAAPNDFFTNPTARLLYQKRLRYVLARWGASPNLLCWEFFNEIDNDYNVLNSTNVASWHNALGPWLRQHDPYQRLITTSLTGSSDRPEIWKIASLDFAQYHSYGLAQPAAKLPPIVQDMMTRYQKPVLVGEVGIDSSGFHAEEDPYFRGLRQSVWAGLLGGAPGTAMSWWWEEIHARNLYPLYQSISQFLSKTALGQGNWNTIKFVTNGDAPVTVGNQIPGAAPFTATLNLTGQWGFLSAGALALPNPAAAGSAPAVFDAFFQGTSHPELRNPCKISAWFGTNAQIVLHLNSVSDGSIINIRIDNVSVYSQAIPNKDGGYSVNNEYNTNYFVPIPAGKHLVEVRNAGADWFYLDWLRLDNVQPSTYLNNWTESPVAIGLSSPSESLLYIVNPAANFPANALTAVIPPLTNATVRLTNWPAGNFTAIWHDPKTFQPLGQTSATTTNHVLQIPVPDFPEDLAARLIPENRVALQLTPGNLTVSLTAPAPANTTLQTSTNLLDWQSSLPIPFAAQQLNLPPPAAGLFYRLSFSQ